jgi:hypothetical protein
MEVTCFKLQRASYSAKKSSKTLIKAKVFIFASQRTKRKGQHINIQYSLTKAQTIHDNKIIPSLVLRGELKIVGITRDC